MSQENKSTIMLLLLISVIMGMMVLSYDPTVSYCLDWETNEDIDHKYCREESECRKHCESKNMSYGWNNCCVTDGGPPEYVNIQGCDCV